MVLLPFFGDVFKVLGVNVLLFWFINWWFFFAQRRKGAKGYFVCLWDSSSLSISGYHILNEMSMVLLPFFGDVFKVLGVNVLLFWFIGWWFFFTQRPKGAKGYFVYIDLTQAWAYAGFY